MWNFVRRGFIISVTDRIVDRSVVCIEEEDSRAMPTVTFVKEKKTVEVPAGTNLRRAAMQAGVPVYTGVHQVLNCQGFGHCGSCRMVIKKGIENCSRQGLLEKFTFNNVLNPLAFFARLGHEKDMRLSCQTQVNGDVEVEATPAFNWHGENFFS